MKLTNKEKKESMFVTWGRILTITRYYCKYFYYDTTRLTKLVEKFNKDLEKAKIEEGYFNEK